MVRRLRIEKLPENVSVSPSRGSCRRNAHSRLRQCPRLGETSRECLRREGRVAVTPIPVSGRTPSGVAARRGSGSLRPYVAPTSTEGARNRRGHGTLSAARLLRPRRSSGVTAQGGSGPLPPRGPSLHWKRLEPGGSLSSSATSCSSMISGQRLFSSCGFRDCSVHVAVS